MLSHCALIARMNDGRWLVNIIGEIIDGRPEELGSVIVRERADAIQWALDRVGNNPRRIYYDEKDFPAEGEAEAFVGAHLIAAAPELLAALRSLLDRYVDLASSGDCGFWDCEKELQVIEARAAIAKATSREAPGSQSEPAIKDQTS